MTVSIAEIVVDAQLMLKSKVVKVQPSYIMINQTGCTLHVRQDVESELSEVCLCAGERQAFSWLAANQKGAL